MIDKRSTRAYKLEKENRELKKEIERLKKREQECIDHYLVQCKYASEMEGKYISANYIINELEKWLEESIEKHTEDYLDWKYDKNVYLAGSEKLQNVFDKLQELKGADK